MEQKIQVNKELFIKIIYDKLRVLILKDNAFKENRLLFIYEYGYGCTGLIKSRIKRAYRDMEGLQEGYCILEISLLDYMLR